MELVANYRVETDLSIRKAAEAIAAEQSTGTWTVVRGQNNPLAARVIPTEGMMLRSAFLRGYLIQETFPSTFLWWQEISSA